MEQVDAIKGVDVSSADTGEHLEVARGVFKYPFETEHDATRMCCLPR